MFRCPSCHRRVGAAARCPRDGWIAPRLEPEGALQRPPRIDGFTLGEELGRGGFAVVWAAERAGDAPSSAHGPASSRAAVKVALAATPAQVARFAREADALERVGPPHVARLFRRGQLDDGRPYLVMERLSGGTLADALAALPHPPDPAWAARRAGCVLAALEAAHARGVLHRDLKPENVFFTEPDDRAVLLDFGLTTRADPLDRTALTRAGAVVGTPEYMAPEQLRGDAVDARADLYAFGVLLFELLTLRLPFAGDPSAVEHGHLALRPPRPSELAPVPPALEELVLACLAKDPARRPPSAAALRRALAEAVAGALADAPAGRAVEPPPPPAAGARLVSEGRHPVVLLFVEASGAAATVVAAITARKGLVVRQRGSRYVGVFSGRDAEDPARAALAAARELVEGRGAGLRGARAALHLASVTVRRKDRGPVAVYGAPVDRPETWLPAEPWSGVAHTADFERALPEEETPPSTTPAPAGALRDAAAPGPSAEVEIPLLGQGGVLDAMAASAAAAFDGTCPALFTLIGDAGLGKSRLAAEAAAVAKRAHPDALVLSVRAAQPMPGEPPPETAELLRHVLAAPAEPPADVRAFCEDRLGPELGAAAAPALAAALGWAGPAADAASASHHHAVLRALAEGLRRRARRGPVAVILDDAHWADDAVLDALEYATLDGAGVPLWAVVAAQPRFEQLRRGWGGRTQRFDARTLAPLDEPSGMSLAAFLLLPAEYPPAEVLRRLTHWAGGNPACLREIVRSLKRAGIVRRRPNAESHYVATAELESLPPSPAWQWLATRQLDALPPELAACVRICAVLGVSFTRAELEQVLEAADRAGSAGTPVDAGFGLDELVQRGILQRGGGERYSFQNAVFRDAVYDLLDPGQREQIHRHALSFWQSRAGDEQPEQLEPLARHAGACGERAEATRAYVRLGDNAFSKHRHVEADQHYTNALGIAGETNGRERMLALAGRGKSRYRMYRVVEARDDLSRARELAAILGDKRLVADLLLEDATALDWSRDFEESASRAEEARALVEELGAPELHVRLLVALGRTCWRQRRTKDSIELLEEAIDRSETIADYEPRIVALLILSFELAVAGRLEDAEARFHQVISLAAAAHDQPHLGAAYANRVALSLARRSPQGAIEDLRRAIDLARETGNHWLERAAAYNVATVLHWSDWSDWSDQGAEALVLARRARMLEERFSDKAVSMCSLLVARILVLQERYEQAHEVLAWVDRSCRPNRCEKSGMQRYIDFHMLRLVLEDVGFRTIPPEEGEPGGWDEVLSVADGAGLSVEEWLELLYWRARTASRRDDATLALEQAHARREGHPMWLSRFEELSRQVHDLQAAACSR